MIRIDCPIILYFSQITLIFLFGIYFALYILYIYTCIYFHIIQYKIVLFCMTIKLKNLRCKHFDVVKGNICLLIYIYLL